MAHSDGSGFELLSSQALETLLLEAHANPAIAVLKEVVPEFPGKFRLLKHNITFKKSTLPVLQYSTHCLPQPSY